MQKFNLELPKYRLQLQMKLIKRRKPLLDEPVIPTVADVKKKYKTGTIIGKFVRYISGHKSASKLFAGNMAAVVIVTSFLPSFKINDAVASDNNIIQTQTVLVTEKGVQLPFNNIKLNQGFNLFHPGIDFGGDVGEPIKAIRTGSVTEAGYSKDGYGNTIVVDHGNGLISRYAHLSKIQVETGQKVDMNTEIGKLGITGRTTGPHLHLEVYQNGVAINPLTILPK